MGQKHVISEDMSMSTERKSISGQLSENRQRYKHLMVNMTKRVLSSSINSKKLEFLVLPDQAVSIIITFLLDEIRVLMAVSPI